MKMSKDIYFNNNYGLLYEKIENGASTVFELKTKNGTVKNLFLKRKAPSVNGQDYYEIITPYGYGGAVIEDLTGDKNELVKEYEQAFSEYCKEQNIVCEFVRFHPIVNNAKDFESVYSPIFSRKTLGTNLVDFEDPIASEFSKSTRKKIRKALNSGVTYVIDENPSNLDEFKEVYYATMDRNNAADYYYFGDEYFENVLKFFKDNTITCKAVLDGKTIAMGLYFISDGILHIHLSGTFSEYLHLSPAVVLRFGVCEWAIKNGYKLIHHGGGRTNDPEDSLYTFKKNFAQNTEFDFYIAKKIWNKDAYNAICENEGVDSNADFFPAWRSR